MTDWQHGFYKLSADDRRQQLTEARQLSPYGRACISKYKFRFRG
jgi:hypothetical protein